jgi:L-threonylcarbamoyladenylate synthase
LGRKEAAALPEQERSTKGLLDWGEIPTSGFKAVRNLSPSGSMIEAASHLFQFLRELDQAGLAEILAIPWLEHGLGRAINDRLRRAEH